MFLQLAEGTNDGNYSALAETGGVMDAYVFIPAGFLPEFDKDTYVRADYFEKYDPTTAEALLNALMSQQTVGLSVVGVAAVATGGLKLAKQLIDNRKAKVASGEKKPLFKPGGFFDKVKGAIKKDAPATTTNEEKKFPNVDINANVDGQQFGVTYTKPDEQAPVSFFTKYKTPLLIGGGLLAAGLIYMTVRKKK
jgi:hypothetical protein